MPGARCFQRGGVDSRVRSWLDVGDDELAPFFVGYADHGGLQDGRVADQDVLDLLGVDVLAATNDHVFRSPDECQIAVRVEMADVTGVQPAIDDDARRFLRTSEVAAHDVGASHDDLTVGPRRRLGTGCVEDPNLLSREGKPHCAGASWAREGVDGGAACSF